MTLALGVLHGDGIGPAIVSAAVEVLEACEDRTGGEIDLRPLPVGWQGYREHGSALPERTVDALEDCDGCILGPVLSGEYPADDPLAGNPSGALRTHFDLYANVRPVRSYPGIGPEGMDLVLFRQNTEGFYADRNLASGNGEFRPVEDVVLSFRVVTKRECERIATRAFEFARREGRSRVTAVHKANVLTEGDGLFLDVCRDVARDYPDVELADALVDAFAMKLVRAPAEPDVVVTTNMFGDVLSDEAAGVVGTPGLAPGLNVGDGYAIAQAAHGAAPDIAGSGVANPIAMILSVKLLLAWLHDVHDVTDARIRAEMIDVAVRETLREKAHLTPDLGGEATTAELTEAIVGNLPAEP